MVVEKNAFKTQDLGYGNMRTTDQEKMALNPFIPYKLVANKDYTYPRAGGVHFPEGVEIEVSGLLAENILAQAQGIVSLVDKELNDAIEEKAMLHKMADRLDALEKENKELKEVPEISDVARVIAKEVIAEEPTAEEIKEVEKVVPKAKPKRKAKKK